MKLFNTLMVILTTMFAGWVGILFAQCETDDGYCDIKPYVEKIHQLEDKLQAYRDYYKACEEFLDTLENHFNWVDGFDPMNYYDAIESVHKIENNQHQKYYSWEVAGMFSDIIRAHSDHGCTSIMDDYKTTISDTTLLNKYVYGY